MKIKRVAYFVYYIKQLDRVKLKEFFSYVQQRESTEIASELLNRKSTRVSGFKLWNDVILSSFNYNISILDYFYFRFYKNKDQRYRQHFAGTGFLYEYQLKMNPKKSRSILEDKIVFLNLYTPFIKRSYTSLHDLEAKGDEKQILRNKSGKIVLKGSKGQVGAEVEVIETDQYSFKNLLEYMKVKRYDLLEEYVVQHDALMALSPSGLNTVRIFSQIQDDQCILIGARLRISVNSTVDNMGAGNIACCVDIDSGIVDGPGVYSTISKDDVYAHPITGVNLIGFQIPYWKETLKLIEDAAFFQPDNRSIGWDIAITKQGPELIEGNHNWCKLLWQLPVKTGLKPLLKYFY